MINKFEFIVYVWISVSLYRLHLDWCQFISSTFGFVSVYIIYVWVVSVYIIYKLSVYIWCQLIQSTFGVVSVCSVYFCIGVSLYHLWLDLRQFVSPTFGVVSVYIIYVLFVSVYIIYVLRWCQSISSTFGIV